MGKYSLTNLECQVLWKKYVKSGMDADSANDKLKNVKLYLRNLMIKLKQQNKTPEQIQDKFNKEFEKIWMEAETNG